MIQSWLIDMIIQEEYAERAELGWLWSYTKVSEFSFAEKDGCAKRAMLEWLWLEVLSFVSHKVAGSSVNVC